MCIKKKKASPSYPWDPCIRQMFFISFGSEFDKHPSDHLLIGISDHFTGNARTLSHVISRFEFCPWRCPLTNFLLSDLFVTSGEIDDNIIPVSRSKWKSAHMNLMRISFSHKSQNGCALRFVDLLTFPVKDSTRFFFDDTSFTHWRLTALLVSLVNVKTRLGRVLFRFFFCQWKNINTYTTISISMILIQFKMEWKEETPSFKNSRKLTWIFWSTYVIFHWTEMTNR